MRFVYGPIPEGKTFDAEKEGWMALRQLNVGRYTVLSTIIAVPFAAVAFWYLLQISVMLKSNVPALVTLAISMLMMLPVHEMLHATAFRNWLKDPHLMVGLWPSIGMWVCYDGPQPRNRLLFMLCVPFLVLSVMPLAALIFLPTSQWTLIAGFFSLVHIAACTGDFQTFLRVRSQVPGNAVIQNKGWQTYWRITQDTPKTT